MLLNISMKYGSFLIFEPISTKYSLNPDNYAYEGTFSKRKSRKYWTVCRHRLPTSLKLRQDRSVYAEASGFALRASEAGIEIMDKFIYGHPRFVL